MQRPQGATYCFVDGSVEKSNRIYRRSGACSSIRPESRTRHPNALYPGLVQLSHCSSHSHRHKRCNFFKMQFKVFTLAAVATLLANAPVALGQEDCDIAAVFNPWATVNCDYVWENGGGNNFLNYVSKYHPSSYCALE